MLSVPFFGALFIKIFKWLGGVSMKKKELIKIVGPREQHWVGNGFLVNTIFSPHSEDYKHITPFILMDHAAPKKFEPTSQKLGVGEHPHRGFETVTFAIKGEVAHRDSGGGGGTITTGGVQWMTAASGVVHEEFHSQNFANKGGEFEMVQLWVNLPAKDKMTKPRYQSLNQEEFPIVNFSNTKAQAKIIAGSLLGSDGPAKTFTPINIYEINALDESLIELNFKPGSNTLFFQLKGASVLNEKELANRNIAIFNRDGEVIKFKMKKDSKLLVLNGEPIDEPIVTHGPFVMNTEQEIVQAIRDFQMGKMGQLVNES